MKLIIGIGNPGIRYLNSRHNVGFRILDRFCQIHNLKFQPAKNNFWLVESNLETFHFFLVKPTTYVNNSGVAVKEILASLNLSLRDILVIYDDSNMDIGELRIRKSGSDGGHNGLKSIIYHLENDNFTRLRIGIGSPIENEELADYVLTPFPQKDIEKIENKYSLILNLIEQFICGGSTAMLNYYSKESNINSTNIS